MSVIQPQTPWNQCRTQEKNSSRLSEDKIVKLLTSNKWQKARIRNTEYCLMDVDEYLQGNSETVQIKETGNCSILKKVYKAARMFRT